MNHITIVSIGLGVVSLLSVIAVGEAQHQHGHPAAKEGAHAAPPRDERVALGLAPETENGLKLTMREHLEAIRDIVAALSRQEFDAAAQVAQVELGFPKHHQAMERESGATFPSKYHELAMAHHQEAEDLAKVFPSKDLQTILPKLERTIGACVSCHRAYKL